MPRALSFFLTLWIFLLAGISSLCADVTITYTSGALAGYKITEGHDTSRRDTGFELTRGNVVIHSAQQAPNGASAEVSDITSGNVKIHYVRNEAARSPTSSGEMPPAPLFLLSPNLGRAAPLEKFYQPPATSAAHPASTT